MTAKTRNRLQSNRPVCWKYVRLRSSLISKNKVFLLLLWIKNINNWFLQMRRKGQTIITTYSRICPITATSDRPTDQRTPEAGRLRGQGNLNAKQKPKGIRK